MRVQKTVEKVNAKLKAAAGADATKVKQQALEKEIAQLKTEIEKLAKLSLAIDEPALPKGQITERATRLKKAKRELAALGEPQGPMRLLPTMTGDALRKRLDNLWGILSGPHIDNDRACSALQELFGEDILVSALDGDWSKGWLMKLKTRPWALVLRQPVVSEDPACLGAWPPDESLLTPAQAAARFDVPACVLRKACAEGDLDHLRVINAVWLAPSAVAAFAKSWRARGAPRRS